MTYKKKLIEVALPLEDINREAAREKSIRHGHPSTLHQWWARRPLAACRAVLFSSLVDDPSECVKELLADADIRDGLFRHCVRNPSRFARGAEAVLREDKPVAVVKRRRSHWRSL